MKRPVVSVLVPVYNVEKYLSRCLDSILQQTLSNIEVICVNDGSTDRSAQILADYAEMDKRIIVLTKENGGLPSARNAALDKACGKYVGFVDSDDYIQPDMFERLVNTAEEKSSDIVICGANIFPETPKASQWLYDTLSPSFKHYDGFDPEVLFDRVDTTPFLWRILVRRKLIDKGDFRLDEDIIIGEDKAFQSKIYPAAKAITVIPDKLYNYYWCRPESLMDKQVYGKYSHRVKEHVRLIEHIVNNLTVETQKNNNRNEDTFKSFLEWSIPFIYSDFIYLSEQEKCELAGGIIATWKKADFYHYKYILPEWKREQFYYIQLFVDHIPKNKPQLSIIVPVDDKTEYVNEWKKQIMSLDDGMEEIIIINNGTSNENYIKIQDLLYRNPRVRLYNTPEHLNFADSLNMGINLAGGEYITFYEVQDWYKSKNALLKWTEFAQKNKMDICISKNAIKKISADKLVKIEADSKLVEEYLESDFHEVLYNKEFLKKNEIVFTNASVLTGYLFLCRALMTASNIRKYDDTVYIRREMHHADWLSTQKCELVLSGLEELVALSLKKQNPYLHGKVFSILNGNVMKHIIVNNTKPYCMPPEQCPNGENSQIQSVSALFRIISKADPELLYKAGYSDDDNILDVLYEVIKERHRFLATI